MATKMPTESELIEYEERFVKEVWNGRNLGLIDEMVTDDYVGHWFAVEEGGPTTGPEGLREFIGAVHEGFSDFEMEIEFTIAQDDMIAVGFTTTGTHDGEFMGIPATGEEGSTPGIFAHRFEDGKVAEAWATWDALGLLQQVGVVPEKFTLGEFLETGARLAKQDVLKMAGRD